MADLLCHVEENNAPITGNLKKNYNYIYEYSYGNIASTPETFNHARSII